MSSRNPETALSNRAPRVRNQPSRPACSPCAGERFVRSPRPGSASPGEPGRKPERSRSPERMLRSTVSKNMNVARKSASALCTHASARAPAKNTFHPRPRTNSTEILAKTARLARKTSPFPKISVELVHHRTGLIVVRTPARERLLGTARIVEGVPPRPPPTWVGQGAGARSRAGRRYCTAEVSRARLSSTVERSGCFIHSARVSSRLSSR